MKIQESSSECYTINITPRFSLSLGFTYLIRTDCRLFLSFRSVPLVICFVINDQQPGKSCASLKPRIITWRLLHCWWVLSDSRTWFRTNSMGYRKRSWASRAKHGNTDMIQRQTITKVHSIYFVKSDTCKYAGIKSLTKLCTIVCTRANSSRDCLQPENCTKNKLLGQSRDATVHVRRSSKPRVGNQTARGPLPL